MEHRHHQNTSIIGTPGAGVYRVLINGVDSGRVFWRHSEAVEFAAGKDNSGQTLAAMEIYKDMPIVVITPTSSETSITQQGYRNFFRINANDTVQADVDAAFLVNQLGAKRVAVLHNDTPYGIGLRNEMSRALKNLGAEVVLTLQVKEGQSRFLEEAAKIDAVQPDGIFYAGYEIEAPYLRADLIENGLDMPMLASDGAFLAATIDESNGTAEGMYVSAFAPSPRVAGEPWIEAYQAVEYRNPDTYSVNGYSAMAVLAEGIKKANSLDAAKVADAIRSLDYKGIIGQLQFQSNGDLQDPQMYIFQVQNNEFTQVAP